MRYEVWGYLDEDPAEETLLYSSNNLQKAIAYAKVNGMATAVVDRDSDETLWTPS